MKMNKKTVIFLIVLLTLIIEAFGEEKKPRIGEFFLKTNAVILNLPYEVEADEDFVFDEDTPFAIDIIEIKADGKKLLFINDPSVNLGRSYYNICKTSNEQKEFFVSMFWLPIYGAGLLRWNDGSGIISTEILPNIFSFHTFSYEISSGMKMLEIKYRIMLQYQNLSIDTLYDKNYKHKRYTKEYNMVVDIGDIFEQISKENDKRKASKH